MRLTWMGLLFVCATAACNSDPVLPVPEAPVMVVELDRFQEYIASKPTPEQFREQYPTLTLVLPGEIASKELRLDRSRYFAELDDRGRIIGGRFR